jgi:hypothetical protein
LQRTDKEAVPQDRIIMANYQRSLKESIKAWRTFEKALQNLDGFDACAKWVIDHPEICKKLSGQGLMAVMKEDLKKKLD